MHVKRQGGLAGMNNEPVHEALLIILQLIPYIGYLFILEEYLDKNVAADSFRYLWENGSLFAYLTNSSLSVRFLYTLLGNDVELISIAQLLIVAVSQVAIYRSMRCGNKTGDTVLALLLIVLYSSHNSRWLFNFAMSDSLFTSLYILLVAVICAGDDRNRGKVKIISFFLVALFVFSRNTAPYIALFCAVGVFTVKLLAGRKSYLVTSAVIMLSLVALTVIKNFDTSTQLNAAQNIILKIFPDKEKTDLFHKRYDMPVGPFVEACKGGNVNSYCFDYQRIQTGSTYTRTYKVTVDNYGFADWVREKGMQSWQHYLLVHDFANTVNRFISGYRHKFSTLFARAPADFWGEAYKTPLIPFDPFLLCNEIFIRLKLDNVYSLAVFVLVSLLCFLFTDMKREFLFTGVLLVSGLALVFIGLFGDIGSDRQVYPGILSIYLGQVLFFYCIGRLAVRKIVLKNTSLNAS